MEEGDRNTNTGTEVANIFYARARHLVNELIISNQITLLDAAILSAHLAGVVGMVQDMPEVKMYSAKMIGTLLRLDDHVLQEFKEFKLPIDSR